MSNFRFEHPAFLLGLLAMVAFLIYRTYVKQTLPGPVLRYSDTRLMANVPVGLRVRLRKIPDVLLLAALCLLIIVAAGPQTNRASASISGSGLDIAIALDISGSMAANDIQPDRFAAAREIIARFIDERATDRIGLVVFAENAYYLVPLTLNHNILRQQLGTAQLSSSLGLGERTAVGIGIASAANMLRNSDAPERVMILVTDGTSNAGTVDPITAAQTAAALNIRIYAVGIGSSTAQSTDVALDESTLQQVASMTGGAYYSATDRETLDQIYREINRLETIDFSRQIEAVWVDWQTPWLLLALALLIVERLLRRTIFQAIP